jgi:hypothetical protein
MRGIVSVGLVLAVMTGAWAKSKPKRVTVTNFPATQAVEVQNFPPVGAPPPAPLAPSKPSQIVTLTYDGFCAGGTSLDNIIGIRIMPDGTTQPFTIPPGQVLVVTGIDWSAYRCPPSTAPGTVLMYVFLGATGRVAFADTAVIGAGATPTSACSIGGKASIVPNLVVKPGIELCAGFDNQGFSGSPAIVHGFLTSDE